MTSYPEDFESGPFRDITTLKEIVRMQATQDGTAEVITSCVEQLTRDLLLTNSGASINLASFNIYKALGNDTSIISSYSSTQFPLDVYLVERFWTTVSKSARSYRLEHVFIGILNLKIRFPHTLIYKETLHEKIEDFFVRADLDLKGHKKFSSAFRVLTENKDQLTIQLNHPSLDDLATFPDMQLEIVDRMCMFRSSEEHLDENSSRKFVELAGILQKILL